MQEELIRQGDNLNKHASQLFATIHLIIHRVHFYMKNTKRFRWNLWIDFGTLISKWFLPNMVAHIFGQSCIYLERKIDNFSVFLNFFTANLHQPEYLSWTRCIRELEPKEAKFVVCPAPKS